MLNPKTTIMPILQGERIINRASPEACLGGQHKLRFARASLEQRTFSRESSSRPRSPLPRVDVSASPEPVSGKEDNS
jgi:hypothetical protein